MTTITFDEIRARVDAYHATHNSTSARARRAALELRSLMLDLGERERYAVLRLLLDELATLDQPPPPCSALTA